MTQIYETGACVYIYFAFNYGTYKIPKDKVVEMYEEIEEEARDEVMKHGGSLSHHHGIGKLRKRFMNKVLPPASIKYLLDAKKQMDPKNIFASNNTIYSSEQDEIDDHKGVKFGTITKDK